MGVQWTTLGSMLLKSYSKDFKGILSYFVTAET